MVNKFKRKLISTALALVLATLPMNAFAGTPDNYLPTVPAESSQPYVFNTSDQRIIEWFNNYTRFNLDLGGNLSNPNVSNWVSHFPVNNFTSPNISDLRANDTRIAGWIRDCPQCLNLSSNFNGRVYRWIATFPIAISGLFNFTNLQRCLNGSFIFSPRRIAVLDRALNDFINSPAVSDNSSEVSGNSSEVSGNNSAVSGNNSAVSGNSSEVSGNSSEVSGNNSEVSGNNSEVSGNSSEDLTCLPSANNPISFTNFYRHMNISRLFSDHRFNGFTHGLTNFSNFVFTSFLTTGLTSLLYTDLIGLPSFNISSDFSSFLPANTSAIFPSLPG